MVGTNTPAGTISDEVIRGGGGEGKDTEMQGEGR